MDNVFLSFQEHLITFGHKRAKVFLKCRHLARHCEEDGSEGAQVVGTLHRAVGVALPEPRTRIFFADIEEVVLKDDGFKITVLGLAVPGG
eukprot:3003847-Amphidinium_carterae.1